MSTTARYFPFVLRKLAASVEQTVHKDDTRVNRRSITRYSRSPLGTSERDEKRDKWSRGRKRTSSGEGKVLVPPGDLHPKGTRVREFPFR